MKPKKYASISMSPAAPPTAIAPAAKSSAPKSISPRYPSLAMPSRPSWRARSLSKRLPRLARPRPRRRPRQLSTSPLRPSLRPRLWSSVRRVSSRRSLSLCALRSPRSRCPNRRLPYRHLRPSLRRRPRPPRLRRLLSRAQLRSRPQNLPRPGFPFLILPFLMLPRLPPRSHQLLRKLCPSRIRRRILWLPLSPLVPSRRKPVLHGRQLLYRQLDA